MRSNVILAVSAHPDDETLGCGGTLALHADMGSTVKVLCLTCPSEERRRELQEASKVLGIAEPTIFDDESLKDEEETVARVSDAIVSTQPDIIITHMSFDYHREHRLTLKLVMEAIEWAAHTTIYSDPWNTNRLLQMEVNTLIPTPHILVDTTEAFDRKMKALDCYASQHAKFPESYYRSFTKLKAELRGIQGGCRYAEAFTEEPLPKNSPFYKLRSTSDLFAAHR